MGDLVERAAEVILSARFFGGLPANIVAVHRKDNTVEWQQALHVAQALSDAGMLAEGGKTTDRPVIFYTPHEGGVPDYFSMQGCTIEPSQGIATATVRHLSPEEAREALPTPPAEE